MKIHRVCGALVAAMGVFVVGTASADAPTTTGTIVLNTYTKVLPMMIGDGLGPTRTDPTTNLTVPRVGRCTGSGFSDTQLKIDDSPAASANFKTDVPLLITATRTKDAGLPANNNSNNGFEQGAFAVVHLGVAGPALDTMSYVKLPELNGERTWMKPNIMATDKYYLAVAASEDNGVNNNPQVVAFLIDKTTLKTVKVLNSNRKDSTLKPTNLIELSKANDGQQYGPHSIARVVGTDNSFFLGVQRNNQNAYVMRVNVVDVPGQGVNLEVPYLTRVINNAQHCRPDVIADPETPNVAYLTSVEANSQPADIGVRALSFDVTTGKVIKSVLVAKSAPGNNKYAVQPNIALLGKYIGISYQLSEKTRQGGNGNGHSSNGANLSMVQLLDKTTLASMGQPTMGVSAYARHAGGTGILWGEDGKEMPSFISLSGSATGAGKAFMQVIPTDQTAGALGSKIPDRLYDLSIYSDVAGTITRGKRNPNNQGRGFIYAIGNIANPGYNGGNTAFMPEVKSFVASAVTGYTNKDTATVAARESVWLSLVPATWVPGQPTTPGSATDTPGTGPGGLGPLPRTGGTTGTSTDPNAPPPQTVIPGGDSPEPPSGNGGNDFNQTQGGCAVTTTQGTDAGSGLAFLVALGAFLGLRRKSSKGEN